jgi:ABC-type nitrate/sulfonate/bicarbonate transport system substrate-binding protein
MNASIRVAVAAFVLFAGASLPVTAQPLTAFRVGISDAVNTVLPVWMAQEGGFYAANGLQVEIVNMGGGSRGAKALQAGTIDLMRVGMSSVVQANRAGGDLRLIASMSNVIRFVLAVAPDVKTAAI